MTVLIKAALRCIRWIVAARPHNCGECRAFIAPGDRMALYRDFFINSKGQREVILRRYCPDCAQLLEDSITTTEAA